MNGDTPPNVTLRDGWSWTRCGGTRWFAEGPQYGDDPTCFSSAAIDVHGKLQIFGDVPNDVVAIVLAVGAPETFLAAAAKLAAPADPSQLPKHYRLEPAGTDMFDVALFDWHAAVDGDANWERSGDVGKARHAIFAHRNAVVADAYPELAARIVALAASELKAKRAWVDCICRIVSVDERGKQLPVTDEDRWQAANHMFGSDEADRLVPGVE